MRVSAHSNNRGFAAAILATVLLGSSVSAYIPCNGTHWDANEEFVLMVVRSDEPYRPFSVGLTDGGGGVQTLNLNGNLTQEFKFDT